jgi:hypothetical protein
LRGTTQTAARGTAVLDRASDLVLATTFLRASFADARPLPDMQDGNADHVLSFDGQNNRIFLVTAAPPHLRRGGFYNLTVTNDREQRALSARWSPVSRDDDAATTKAPLASRLLDRVDRITFDYFGMLVGEASPSWHREWLAQPVLPRAIRLRIGFTDGTMAPELVVAVRTAVEGPQ